MARESTGQAAKLTGGGGLVTAAGEPAVLVAQDDRPAVPAGMSLLTPTSSGRLGPPSRALAVGVVVADPVQLDAQPDHVIQGGRVDVAGDDGSHGGVARHRGGGVPVQPRPAVTAAH
jgi:hypothetical protein